MATVQLYAKMTEKDKRKEKIEKVKRRDGIIDRAFGMFYGIRQLDKLNFTMWNMHTPTVLPEYEPSPY